MANELAKHLSHMKISELNSDETENIFKVKIDTELSFLHDSGRLQESLRVWMNPRDMTSMKLIAGLLINIRNQIYACWPSSLTLLNSMHQSVLILITFLFSSENFPFAGNPATSFIR